MKKLLVSFIALSVIVLVVGCSEKESSAGDFTLYNTGFPFKANETYYIVNKIDWTGETPVKIKSIELIKGDGTPISYEIDGIGYEVFGADPLKTSGVWPESDIGGLKSIENLEIVSEGKIVIKLKLGTEVKEDSSRRVKIKYSINGDEKEKIVKWITLEQLTTINN